MKRSKLTLLLSLIVSVIWAYPKKTVKNINSQTIIDTLYVTRSHDNEKFGWINAYTKPDDNSPTGDLLKVGTKVFLLERNGRWLTISDSTVWLEDSQFKISEKKQNYGKLYIHSDEAGKIDDLLLRNEDLNLTYSDTLIKNYTPIVPADSGIVKMQLITKDEYLRKKETGTNFYIKDTLKYPKIKGSITIPCKTKNVTFTDNSNSIYNHYNYIGEWVEKNAYLISGTYYGSSEYFFVSKATGDKIETFPNYPIISPDRKYIASIFWYLEEERSYFVVYKFADGPITKLIGYDFISWLPLPGHDDREVNYFWGADYNIYACVKSSRLAGQKSEANLLQYIKITIPRLQANNK